jgi:hypothetical protein
MTIGSSPDPPQIKHVGWKFDSATGRLCKLLIMCALEIGSSGWIRAERGKSRAKPRNSVGRQDQRSWDWLTSLDNFRNWLLRPDGCPIALRWEPARAERREEVRPARTGPVP